MSIPEDEGCIGLVVYPDGSMTEVHLIAPVAAPVVVGSVVGRDHTTGNQSIQDVYLKYLGPHYRTFSACMHLEQFGYQLTTWVDNIPDSPKNELMSIITKLSCYGTVLIYDDTFKIDITCEIAFELAEMSKHCDRDPNEFIVQFAPWNTKEGTCDYCKNVPIGDLKECQGCHRVSYCSEECRGKDWEAGHKYFCQAKETLEWK
jgi:hypothetical protein